ncbi:MAG: anthranilate phosphoribosyltransferase [Peptococcaceae bacterium]
MIREAIGKVTRKENLSLQEAAEVMAEIMGGEATESQIGSFLTALRMKGETPDEIAGCARVMRDKAEKITINHRILVDTCGTGGDGTGTFNISTTAAFVAAGAGLTIAKHGNRSVSSQSGSADVLEALGVKISLNPGEVAKVIEQIGMGFLFAPTFHKAMKHAAGPRREIGIRSIFNILGPLTNPAGAKYQVVGVYDARLTEIVAQVLDKLDVTAAFVVHGDGGLDEISVTGPTKVTLLQNGSIKTFMMVPEDFGFSRRKLADVRGGNAQENADITRRVLEGEKGAARDVVILNAAAAICAAGVVKDLAAGVAMAEETIDTGRALAKLAQLVELTNSRLGVVG